MATLIDLRQVQQLVSQGASLREIARRLDIPWSTFRRHWQEHQRETFRPVHVQVTEMPVRGRPPFPVMGPSWIDAGEYVAFRQLAQG